MSTIRSYGISLSFANCTGITSIDLPGVEDMEGHVFDGWTAEQTIRNSHSKQSWSDDWNAGCNAVFVDNCYYTINIIIF